MSFFYNPRTKQPQIWTYPVFVILAAAVFYGFYAYGENKSRERMKTQQNAEPERTY
jgi:cytochrome c-type biogenesis protein CcmH/NrfF